MISHMSVKDATEYTSIIRSDTVAAMFIDTNKSKAMVSVYFKGCSSPVHMNFNNEKQAQSLLNAWMEYLKEGTEK